MLPTFVIFLREGIEGAMIVAILLAYFERSGQPERARDVWQGVAAALVLALAGGVVAYFTIHHYASSRVQTYFETTTYLIAAVVLTAMTFWMSKHARTMAAELAARSELATRRSQRWGARIVAFQSVGREGLETMVFTLAILFANANQSATALHGNLLLLGALAGLVVAFGVNYAIFRLGRKINFKIFFRVLGILLLFFAAGLLGDVAENVTQLGWLHVGSRVLWNSQSFMSESSSLGDTFHSLIGYAQQPTVLQGVVWLAYVATTVTLLLTAPRRRPRPTV